MLNGPPHPENELKPGDVCDGYRITSLIAAGGMGDVYEAVHDPSGRTVAVKCLKVRHRNKEDARARMKMEAVVLSELQHENLVQVYDAGVTDAGMVWIAMERLHGQTLRELLYRAGRLPIPDALHYASEIADGVDAVHEVNVIHRDLKPENVFVTVENVVKVLDLGTGKFTGYGLNSTDRMRIIGTTAYMSPEQIKGLRVDARADVYALGLIVYEMIAGRHALAAEHGAPLPQGMEQVALMQLQMTPKALSDVAPGCPRYVAAIVEKAIAKDRERRYPNIAAFSRELRAARKRFVAENQLDGAGAVPLGEDLREKFGAPPRSSPARERISVPPRPAPPRADGTLQPVAKTIPLSSPVSLGELGPNDTVADAGCVGPNDFPTDVQTRVQFTLDGSTPPTYVPTLLLSSSSVPAMPRAFGVRSDLTDRSPPPDEVRNRTTQTNPIGFVRVADAPEDDSAEFDLRAGLGLAFWTHPFFRRAAVTLGLGALIGVPPAILGVMWTRHHRGPASTATSAARTTVSAPNGAGTAFAAFPAGATVDPPPAGPAPLTPAAALADGDPSVPSVRTTAAAPEPPVVPVAPAAAAEPKVKLVHASSSPSARAPRARPKTAPATEQPLGGLFVEEPHRARPPGPAPLSRPADPTPKPVLPPSGL